MTDPSCRLHCPLYEEAFQTWREDIRTAIAKLQEGQERLEHELLGNGQPGKVKDFEDRLRLLETHKNKGIGRGSVWLMLGTALLSLIVSVIAAWVSGAFKFHHP